MRLYEILMGVITLGIFIGMLIFGMDRDIARRDYVKGQPVVGCIYKINCKYYGGK